MGRRSRKRSGADPVPPETAPAGGARPGAPGEGARRRASRGSADDGARRRAATSTARRRRDRQLPPPPWAPFPLAELAILIALILLVAGLITWGEQGRVMLLCALLLGLLATLEFTVREHFHGFRSHSTLLAGVITMLVITALVLGVDLPRVLVLPLAAAVFATAFWSLREAFKRRSGGIGFG